MEEFIETCLMDDDFLRSISNMSDSEVIKIIKRIYNEDWANTFSCEISSLTQLESESILNLLKERR